MGHHGTLFSKLSTSLYALIGEFSPFTCKTVVDKQGLILGILLHLMHFYHF